jgi:hypothetical protein
MISYSLEYHMNLIIKRIIKGLSYRLQTYFLYGYSVLDYLRSNEQIYAEPSIGGFFQCYKQPKAMIAALASFRRVYPDSYVHIFCDNGLDFSHVAAYFHCKYEYLGNESGKGVGLNFYTNEQWLEYMERLLLTAQNSTEDFIIILEDDFRVYKKVKRLKFDLNSTKSDHHFYGGKVTTILRARNKSIPTYVRNIYFTGCGGALINRTFYLKHFSDTEKLKLAIAELAPGIMEQWNGFMPQDACLTALMLYFGGTAGCYPGFTEARYWRYKLRLFMDSVAVVHNDKSLYNVPMSKDEEELFF